MRTHLNAGHDIETASQMMTAIESSGGITGVRVTVSGPQPTANSTPVKWEGVSFINNIGYTKEGLHVWRAYGIGSGKFLTLEQISPTSREPSSAKQTETEFQRWNIFPNCESQE